MSLGPVEFARRVVEARDASDVRPQQPVTHASECVRDSGPWGSVTSVDVTKYYELEHYLFGEVTDRFQHERTLSAFDFFCIVVWKANRANTSIAKRLLKQGHSDLELAVQALLEQIRDADDPRSRLAILIEDGIPTPNRVRHPHRSLPARIV